MQTMVMYSKKKMVSILDTVQTQCFGQMTYFRQQMISPHSFPGTGVETCSYRKVQCRAGRTAETPDGSERHFSKSYILV